MRKSLETNVGVLCNKRASSNALMLSLNVMPAHESFEKSVQHSFESTKTALRCTVAEKKI